MIYYADSSIHKENLHNLCISENVCAARILCLNNSYGNYENIVRFWVQYDKSQKASAAISDYCGNITVYCKENADIKEIREFINIIGYVSVMSEIELFPENNESDILAVMCYKGVYQPKKISGCHINFNANLNECYEVLSNAADESFIVPKYEDFIIDISHRLRHGTAICSTVYFNDKAAAFAMTTAYTKTTAVIGAAAVILGYRRRGLGSICVNGLIEKLDGRKIFIVRDVGRNENFYRSMNFENCGFIYQTKRKGHKNE